MAMKTGARQQKDNGNAKARGKDWTRLPILNLPLCALMRPPYSLSPRCYSGFQRRNARVVVVVFFSGTNHPIA